MEIPQLAFPTGGLEDYFLCPQSPSLRTALFREENAKSIEESKGLRARVTFYCRCIEHLLLLQGIWVCSPPLTTPCNSSFRRPDALFWLQPAPAHTLCTYSQPANTCIHK